MKKYNPKVWKEKKEDDLLIEKYGENWKLMKRFKKKVRKAHTE